MTDDQIRIQGQSDALNRRDRIDRAISIIGTLASLSCLIASVAALQLGQMDHAIYFALLTLISEKAGKS